MLLEFAFIVSIFCLSKLTQNTKQQRDTFKLPCYFKLRKFKEVKITGDPMARCNLLQVDRIKFKLVLAEQ